MPPARAGESACPYRATPLGHTTLARLWMVRGKAGDTPRLRGCFCFEVLVRRAVVALRQRRALARLALARRRAAACNAAVERAGFDLVLDELRGRAHALLHGPRH